MSSLSNLPSSASTPSNNPLKAAASRFLQGVQQQQQQQQRDKQDEDNDMSFSSCTCSHDEEQATVVKAPSGKASMSTSTSTSPRADTALSIFPKERQNTPTTTRTSPSGATTSYNNGKEKGNGDTLKREKLQLQDTYHVLARVRFLVVTAILLLGAYTAWGTFRVIKGKDTEQDQDSKDNVNHIVMNNMDETVAQQTVQRLEQVQSMSQALGQVITAKAIQANATFPMFQLPSLQFDRFAVEALQTIPGLQAMLYAPMVPKEQRQAWETYQRTQEEGGVADELQHFVQHEGDFTLPVAQVATGSSHPDATASLSQLPTRHQDLLQQHAWMARAVQLATTQQQPSQHAIWSGILPREQASDTGKDSLSLSSSVSLQSWVMVPIQANFEQQPQPQQHSPAGFLVAIVDWEKLMGQNNVGPDISVVFHSECGTSDTAPTTTVFRSGHHLEVPPDSYSNILNNYPDWDTTMIHRQGDSTIPDDASVKGICAVRMGLASLTLNSLRLRLHQHAPHDICSNLVTLLCLQIRLAFYIDSDAFLKDANTTAAIISSCVAGLIFLGILALFLLYDARVSRRQAKLQETANKMYTIVSGLFPKIVKDRMFSATANAKTTKSTGADSSRALVSFQDAPIADLFPHATIFFADIVGFTAWSSMREPSQVFILLESVFNAFDELAQRYGIFKVETVGDCYVAACGVPDARKDHAVAMARFAVRCVQAMQQVTRDLELTLGPDTTDLDVRIGLHSGSVTAGVLRGERARFQLFGDTMNTASRIEANGAPGRIHISQETANLLRSAGKEFWLKSRDGTIIAKGKGKLNTFWLKYRSPRKENAKSKPTKSDEIVVPMPAFGVRAEDFIAPEERRRRLVEYNKDVLLRLLKRVVAAHRAKPSNEPSNFEHDLPIDHLKHPVEEVAEVINIPSDDYSAEASCDVSEAVAEQLELYISDIAGMYKSNPFHNFEVRPRKIDPHTTAQDNNRRPFL
eukprot:scaffold1684_cov214-Amphora_coffeaeformis.AAC.8